MAADTTITRAGEVAARGGVPDAARCAAAAAAAVGGGVVHRHRQLKADTIDFAIDLDLDHPAGAVPHRRHEVIILPLLVPIKRIKAIQLSKRDLNVANALLSRL